MSDETKVAATGGKVIDLMEALKESLKAARRDWPEDFAHENGRYQCVCYVCKHQFTGHKRRVICALCAGEQAEDAQ